MTFNSYIEDNYDNIKDIVKRNSLKYNLEFNEDVFQSTILKCLERKLENQDNYIGYILKSYSNNIFRESQYYYNKNRSVMDNDLVDNKIHINTVNIFYNYLENIFGNKLIKYFKEWVEGDSIRDIESRYNISNLYNKILKVRNYAKIILSMC